MEIKAIMISTDLDSNVIWLSCTTCKNYFFWVSSNQISNILENIELAIKTTNELNFFKFITKKYGSASNQQGNMIQWMWFFDSIHWFIDSLILSLLYLFIHSLIHSYIHLCIYLLTSVVCAYYWIQFTSS